MVKVGVIGAGHFGRFHTLKLAASSRAELVGLHDPDPARAAAIATEGGTRAVEAGALIKASDAVIIACPTAYHFAHASAALRAGRHVLVEKPITASLEEADALLALAGAAGRVLMAGHIERHSAAIRVLRQSLAGRRLQSLSALRVAPFRPRSLDVSVVLDLMIHDLDLLLALVPAPLLDVRAVGGRVASEHPDWAVAQLRFADGTQAEVTASRVAVALERRLRALGPEGELRVDFLGRSMEALEPGGTQPVEHMPGWGVTRRSWTEHDSLEAEHGAFLDAIERGGAYEADGAAGRAALAVALRVEAAIAAYQPVNFAPPS
jgi:predicted dehydrogenase